MDRILFRGHQQFLRHQKQQHRPLDLPFEVDVECDRIPMTYSCAFEGTYSEGLNEDFSTKLLNFMTANSGDRCGFVLSDHSRCYSFWSADGRKFYLFNSHCVDVNNVVATSIKKMERLDSSNATPL